MESDPGSAPQLDPQVAAVLAAVASAPGPDLERLSPSEARVLYRARLRNVAGQPPQLWKVSDRLIAGPSGELGLRIYQPGSDARPVLVYFHGGGWSFGDLDSHDHICRALTAYSDCVLVSVGYRLAPEHKFPAAVEDAIAATSWVAQNAKLIGADPSRVAVGGDSAGANLAAVVALHARDTGAPQLCFQLLIYPAVDMTMASHSHAQFGAGYRLTRPLMIWSCTNYLRDGRDLIDPRASPLFASSHSGLPPALIVTAQFDPLRDEGRRYAQVLAGSATPVVYRCEDGMIHGFVGFTAVIDRASAALRHMGASLREAMAADRGSSPR
ncbi:MAG TPA: alpha/beta hydrolase [Steroidobacteraceae bacterium]|jgi:acetyl esterase